MYNKEINLFESKLNFNSDKYFLKFENTNVSFRDFKRLILNQKKQLAQKKLPIQSLVLIHLVHPIELLSTVFACLSLNLRPCLANTYFSNDQASEILATNNYSLIINEYNNDDFIESDEEFYIPLTGEIIFFSSGSVIPKACVLTLKNLFFNALGSSKNIPYDSEDIWGLCLPLFHVGGFSIVIRSLLSEASIFIMDKTKEFSQQIIENKISHISLVSTQFYRFLDELNPNKNSTEKSVLDTLKCVLLGGSSISDEKILRALEYHLPVYKSYGMTEMGSQVCATNQFTAKELLSSGKILPYRDLKIEDQRIYVKGPCLFKGYLIKNEIQKVFDESGWFNTKDLGEIHHQEIKIVGRSDRIFQSGGENISPEVIETHLLQIPGIKKVRVLPVDDTEYGKRAVAYLLTEKPFDEVDQIISKKLSGFYRPKELLPWDPKLDSWKN